MNEQPKNPEKLLAFASFDIVGSTNYKATNLDWAKDYQGFLQEIEKGITKIVGWKVWKRLGDEIIFVRELQPEKIETRSETVAEKREREGKEKIEKKEYQLSGIVEDIYENLILLSGYFRRQEISGYKSLDIKAAMWLAYIDESINITYQDISKNTALQDYIGVSMDEGFRVAHACTQPRMLALSFELAYIISTILHHTTLEADKDKSISNIFFLSYQKLKGIWFDRGYPVYWYVDAKNLENEKDEIGYDAEINNTLMQRFLDRLHYYRSKLTYKPTRTSSFIELNHWKEDNDVLKKIEMALLGQYEKHHQKIKGFYNIP